MKIGRAFGALIFLATVAYAADIQIAASLDKNQIALNEQAVLTVTLSGSGNFPDPQLPALPDFQIYNAGKAQNYTWINGQASASVTYNFVITPLKEGKYSIPPIRVASGSGQAETTPLNLEVVKGTPNAVQGGAHQYGNATPGHQSSAALFITGTVDQTTAYVGEPVTYSFRLYNRLPLLSRPNYQPPETSGFWSEDLPPQRSYVANHNGIPYNVTEVKTALFPTTPGKATIGPASLSVRLENLGTDPFSNDFFAQFFGRGEEKVLRTEPIHLTVRSLPEPKPSTFKGAVGQYTLSAGVDKDRVAVGQPLTLTLTISGRGNIKSLPDVTLPELPNFRTFDANAATNIEKKDYQVRGSKVFKTVLIPTASGDVTIPGVPFTFFDSEARQYKTINSRSFTVHVTPGQGGTGPASAPAYPTPSSPTGIRMLTEDIRYIKTPSHLSNQGRALYARGWFRILHLLLLSGLAGLGLFRLYQKIFLSNKRLTRFRNAKENAQKLLARAEEATEKSQVKEAAGLLADALQGFLTAKLASDGQSPALKDTIEALKARGLHTHDAEKIRNLWETLDLFQFAPTQVRPEELKQARRTLDHVIDELEKEIQWKD